MSIYFTYPLDNGIKKKYPFRIGDIIRVTNDGDMYSRYEGAFKHFTNSTKRPYYCQHGGAELVKEFRIIAMIGHAHCNSILTYCKDRLGNDIVIDANGLALVRQCSLRVGENTIIRLDRLKK